MQLTVRAPATVANIGPGFDCLAVALDIRNEFTIETDGAPGISIEGEGAGELPEDGTNVVFRTMTYVARELGGRLPAVKLTCRNRIPLQRGLGSSASAVVAGLLLADRLLDSRLTPDRTLELATDLEGHADNVSACLRGRLTVAYLSREGWRAETLSPHPALNPVVLVPAEERMVTADARRVIPRAIPLADAAFNASRTALAVLALTQRPELLREALEDRVHQVYRLPLIPAARALFQDLRDDGFTVCLAGSGPSLLVFERDGRTIRDLGPGWLIIRPAIAHAGATLTES
jgi:homoserine kinase